MKKLMLASAVVLISLSACNQEPKSTYRPAPAIGGSQEEATEQPIQLPESPAANQNAVVQPLGSGNTALNPEHGQPGHRCDIPVGAPLDGGSAPANNSMVPAQQMPAQQPTTQPTQQAAPKTSGKKLNPAHGEPGHRCDIQVGDPLP